MSDRLEITGLFVHPVKSCRRVEVQKMHFDARGPSGDRLFQFVDEAGRFATQRELPALGRVRCALSSDGERLELDADGHPALEVSLRGGGTPIDVVCWNDTCAALDQGEEVASWIEAVASRPLRLVRMADDFERRVNPRYVSGGATTRFTDGYPLLVTTRASLRDLNERIGDGSVPIGMERFRPNIEVEGGSPYAEDEWRRARVVSPEGRSRLELDFVKPCSRCVLTTADPDTLERGKEPLRTLSRYRRAALGSSGSQEVYFGVNAVHRGGSSIEIGDRLEILETQPSPFA